MFPTDALCGVLRARAFGWLGMRKAFELAVDWSRCPHCTSEL